MVVRQLVCQASGHLRATVDVKTSEELIRWSFFWLYYMFFVFTYFMVVHCNRTWVRWLVIEWALMLLSTCLMTAAVQGQQGATVLRTVSFAIALFHLLWW